MKAQIRKPPQVFGTTLRHEAMVLTIEAFGPRPLSVEENADIRDTARFIAGRMMLLGRPPATIVIVRAIASVLGCDARLQVVDVYEGERR